MKRKAEEQEVEGEMLMWSHGEKWLRGELLSKGSFGSVFLATSKKPRTWFGRGMPAVMAVKSAEVSASASIQHEADVLFYIRGSPFVIERFGEEFTTNKNGKVYNLLLEYASGGTLHALIKKSGGHGLPEYHVRQLTNSILEGIKHIHNCGYLHCDLKPENILLVPSTSTGGFVAKIADSGLEKRTKEHVERWRGTPIYLSPEGLIDNLQDESSDIWSVGCVVLEMLTGKCLWDLKPFSDMEDFLDMIGDDHFSDNIPDEISNLGRDFLKSCLAVRSCERLTAAELLNHPFLVQPQPFEADHRQVASSSLGYADGCCCCCKPNDIVPRIQHSPAGFVV